MNLLTNKAFHCFWPYTHNCNNRQANKNEKPFNKILVLNLGKVEQNERAKAEGSSLTKSNIFYHNLSRKNSC